MLVQPVLPDKLIGHRHSEGLHGMPNGIIEGADHIIVVVHHLFFELHFKIIISPTQPPFYT